MRTREDIESYLMRSNLSFKSLREEDEGEDIWLVRDTSSGENIVISLSGSLVLFRVKVLEMATVENRQPLYEKLLELNASDMVHGSYGLADGAVVLTAGMILETLDYNEFQGTVDDLTLALTNHYEMLSRLTQSGEAA
tara:strand:+ start:392 stop:805 length:414 start_codon:yes stop_codon:yes gene_type:complete